MTNIYTEAQKKAFNTYIKKNDLVSITIRVPRSKSEQYHEDAKKAGKSLTKYIMDKLEGRE